MSEFFAMGGYGAYVWTSYGVTALFLALLFIWSWFGARSRETELEQIRTLSRADRQGASTATLSDGIHGGTAGNDGGGADAPAEPMAAGDAGRTGG